MIKKAFKEAQLGEFCLRCNFEKTDGLLTEWRRMRPETCLCTNDRPFSHQQMSFITAKRKQCSDCVASLTESSTRSINFSIEWNQRLGTLNRCI